LRKQRSGSGVSPRSAGASNPRELVARAHHVCVRSNARRAW
jgi:hypothetical protein